VLIRPARPDEYDEIGELAVRVYLAERYTRTDSRYNAVLRDVVITWKRVLDWGSIGRRAR